MKIAHVGLGGLPPVFSPLGGAIQRRMAELSRAQARRGHEVTVFSRGYDDSAAEIDGVGVRYLRCRSRPPVVHLEYQARVMTRLRRHRSDVDVIHFHSEPEGALVSRGVPALKVLSYDNYYFRRGKKTPLYPLYKCALRAYDLLLPCSNYCLGASTAYWSLPEHRTRVLSNGVNLQQFRQDPFAGGRERDRLGVGEPVLVYLGRVCTQKGTDTLLDAYATLRRDFPRASLVIAGPVAGFGPATDALQVARWEARMRQAGATYLGRVPEERLVGLLNLADVFVMPTKELEMFGMAAIEAQACGTPVVASDHGGLRETVPDSVGLRFPSGDADALASAIGSLLSRPEARQALGRAAVANAGRYSWDEIAASLDEIYDSAMMKGGAAGGD